jgi:hypothetical protein
VDMTDRMGRSSSTMRGPFTNLYPKSNNHPNISSGLWPCALIALGLNSIAITFTSAFFNHPNAPFNTYFCLILLFFYFFFLFLFFLLLFIFYLLFLSYILLLFCVLIYLNTWYSKPSTSIFRRWAGLLPMMDDRVRRVTFSAYNTFPSCLLLGSIRLLSPGFLPCHNVISLLSSSPTPA